MFEFVDHTVLDDLEKCPNGLDENTVRKVLWQVLKGIEFCHLHNVSISWLMRGNVCSVTWGKGSTRGGVMLDCQRNAFKKINSRSFKMY